VPVVQRRALQRIYTNGHGVRTLARLARHPMRNYAVRRVLAGTMRKDAACLAALGAALLFAPAAHAGTYAVVSCQAPNGGGINQSWTVEPYNSQGGAAPAISSFRPPATPAACPAVASLQLTTDIVTTKTVRPGDGAAFVFRAPSGTTVSSVVVYRFFQARPSSSAATTPFWAAVARAGSTIAGNTIIGTPAGGDYCDGSAAGAYPAYCAKGTTGVLSASGTPAGTPYPINQPVIQWGFECMSSTAAGCLTGDGTAYNARMEFQGATVTVEDSVPPVMDAGSPTDGWHTPASTLTASGNDGGGIKDMRVLVDGTQVVSQSFTCDFHLPSPCPTNPQLAVPLTGLSDGSHTVTVTGTDVVSNGGRGDRAVNIDGTPPDVNLVPTRGGRTITLSVADALSGVKGGQIEIRAKSEEPFAPLATTLKSGKLRATVPKGKQPSDFGIRVSATDNAGNVAAGQLTTMTLNTRLNKHLSKVRNAAAKVPYKHDVVVTGRLTTVDGVPLGGQPIRVDSTLRQSRATTQTLRTVTTAPSGRFSFRIPPGPSRRLDITFSGAPDLLHRTRSVTLHVPARSTIHASDTTISGARTVRFSGRLGLLGARLPSGGKIVVLEARQRGRWITVDTTRARGAKASWHAVAHFRGNPGTYPVRLRIPREAVFPYDLGHSRAVKVRVF
jgi:hypothetical protein